MDEADLVPASAELLTARLGERRGPSEGGTFLPGCLPEGIQGQGVFLLLPRGLGGQKDKSEVNYSKASPGLFEPAWREQS